MIPLDPDSLAATLDQRLDADQRAWLADARERVTRDPSSIGALFPAVGRHVGRGMLDPAADRADVHAWTRDDAARTLLLTSMGVAQAEPELPLLYRHGDPAERRGVLRALAYLALPTDDVARPLVDDALRTNDTHLIAAAIGPWAIERLDDAALAQAVLKCVFVGVPLAGIAGLQPRVTPELSEMLARFVHERIAAGRSVPPDVWPVIDRHPPTAELAQIEAELQHAVPERRQAAQAALDARAATTHAH
jgi:hypothetical protein